jgi:putative transposase
MRMLGLEGLGRPKFKKTTQSGESGALPNLLVGGLYLDGKDQVWCSDITYVRTRQGWLYLCAVMDLWSRKIVGWAMSDRMKASLVTQAMKAALKERNPPAGLIFHSDKGSQYRSQSVRKLAQSWGVRQSMTGKDHCYDNASAESLFATLKKELVHRVTFQTREEAKTAIFEFIEVFYNRARAHSALGYVSPLVYEDSQS